MLDKKEYTFHGIDFYIVKDDDFTECVISQKETDNLIRLKHDAKLEFSIDQLVSTARFLSKFTEWS